MSRNTSCGEQFKLKTEEDIVRHKKTSLTLIKLLVVIAIIAILATMILPALNKAKEKVLELDCVNNLKSLSTGFFFYCDDFDGEFPKSDPLYNTATAGSWYNCISGKNAGSVIVGPVYIPHKGHTKKEGNTYFCQPNKANYGSGAGGWTNYAFNSNLISYRIHAVKPDKVLLIDSYNGKAGTYFTNTGARYSSPWQNTWPIHGKNSVNFSFTAGSVQKVSVLPNHNSQTDLGELKKVWFWHVK